MLRSINGPATTQRLPQEIDTSFLPLQTTVIITECVTMASFTTSTGNVYPGVDAVASQSKQELNEWKQEYDRKLKEKAKEDIKKREELFSSEMASKFLKALPEDVSLLFHVGVTGKIRQTDAKFYFLSYHNDNSDTEHLHVRRNDKKSNLNFEKIPHK